MNEAEDVCGCLACAALCGVCCVAAAEEDKRERERMAAEAMQLKSPVICVNPVPVFAVSPRTLKAESESNNRQRKTKDKPKSKQ